MNGLSERLKLMTDVEKELFGAKLLLLTAQMALEHRGEFSLASKISDFLSTPFADSGELALTADKTSGYAPVGLAGNGADLPHAVSPAIFPRTPPSNAGSGVVHRGARPRIVLCNPERKSIVRSAEERGK